MTLDFVIMIMIRIQESEVVVTSQNYTAWLVKA